MDSYNVFTLCVCVWDMNLMSWFCICTVSSCRHFPCRLRVSSRLGAVSSGTVVVSHLPRKTLPVANFLLCSKRYSWWPAFRTPLQTVWSGQSLAPFFCTRCRSCSGRPTEAACVFQGVLLCSHLSVSHALGDRTHLLPARCFRSESGWARGSEGAASPEGAGAGQRYGTTAEDIRSSLGLCVVTYRHIRIYFFVRMRRFFLT